jgi:hypothetical protein
MHVDDARHLEAIDARLDNWIDFGDWHTLILF